MTTPATLIVDGVDRTYDYDPDVPLAGGAWRFDPFRRVQVWTGPRDVDPPRGARLAAMPPDQTTDLTSLPNHGPCRNCSRTLITPRLWRRIPRDIRERERHTFQALHKGGMCETCWKAPDRVPDVPRSRAEVIAAWRATDPNADHHDRAVQVATELGMSRDAVLVAIRRAEKAGALTEGTAA